MWHSMTGQFGLPAVILTILIVSRTGSIQPTILCPLVVVYVT